MVFRDLFYISFEKQSEFMGLIQYRHGDPKANFCLLSGPTQNCSRIPSSSAFRNYSQLCLASEIVLVTFNANTLPAILLL